jgi:hypothetical protein
MRPSARTSRSTGLSPSGTEPWEVVPFAIIFFHQVRFSPTSIPNQRTLPPSTRVSAPSVRTYSISFIRSGCFSTKVRDPRPPISSSALPTYTRSRASGTPARLSAMNAMSWMMPCPFMSSAPRPHTCPSLIAPPKGSTVQSEGVAVTTSMWCTSAIPFPPPVPGIFA